MKKKILLTIVLALSVQSRAQTYTVIHNFTNTPDGGLPQAGLVLNNNTLYGVTAWGGTNNSGAIFKLNTNGSNYSVIKSFSPLVNYFNQYTNAEGAHPTGDLTIIGDTIYGTASAGGHSGNGTVFRMGTDGTQFTVVKDFTNDANGIAVEGAVPNSALILIGDTLYGTTAGKSSGAASFFKIGTNGTGFAVIKYIGANGDLILSGDTFYGTTALSVFSVKTNGLNYTNIWTFTNSPDGSEPHAGLVLSGNTLYGTTYGGGSNDWGTVFKVSTNGTGYTVLKSFSFSTDGGNPDSNLVLISNTLYGTTYMGGPAAYGTLFKINTDGTGFAVIKNFTNSDGLFPAGNLISSGNTLYGNTYIGGLFNNGAVYSLNVTPIIATMLYSNATWTISWNAVSNHVYQLQFTTNLAAPNWQNLGNPITATNGTLSAPVSPNTGIQGFYRVDLSQ